MEGGGCVISEKPPGYEARPYDFPRRNRLISAYSRCLAVVEASERSGTRSTVEIALSLGKDVFAVPGRIGERMSRGCNELIKSGAHILTCPEDILQFLGMDVKKDTIKKPKVMLKPEEKRIFDLIVSGVTDVDGLAEKSAWPVTVLLDILVRLEIRGLIRREKMTGYLPVG